MTNLAALLCGEAEPGAVVSGLAISEAYPLPTFAEAGGRCTRNLIRLVYLRER